MCGHDSRSSVGGTIAVLKGDPVNGCLQDVNLLFNSHDSQSTTATFQSTLNAIDTHVELDKCSIVIHRSGDLTKTPDEKDILHSFAFGPHSMLNGGSSFQLPKKLDLGVGGEGVIGRKISLVRNTPLGLTVFRQGIIGYN